MIWEENSSLLFSKCFFEQLYKNTKSWVTNLQVMRMGSEVDCHDLRGHLEINRKGTFRTQWTYSGSESSLSETAGTTLRGGKSAGLTAVRPLWITSITYLRDRTTPAVRHWPALRSTQAGEQKVTILFWLQKKNREGSFLCETSYIDSIEKEYWLTGQITEVKRCVCPLTFAWVVNFQT